MQIEEDWRTRILLPRCLPGVIERSLYPAAGFFIVGPENLKLFITPERVESPKKTLDNVGCLDFAQLNRPFNTVFQGGSGQVG